MRVIWLSLVFTMVVLVVNCNAGILGELPRAIPAVHVQTQETFSIFTFGEGGYHKNFFHDVTDIRLEGCGVWFVHDGKRKYISGNFVIEPTPRPLGK